MNDTKIEVGTIVRLAKILLARLKPLGPVDLVDVQHFMRVVAAA